MKKIYVVYHANCPDGLLSAAIFKYMIGKHLPSNVLEFIPINYANEKTVLSNFIKLQQLESNSNLPDIVFLDYCPTEEDYVRYLALNNVLVIDHHNDRTDNLKDRDSLVKVTPKTINSSIAAGSYLTLLIAYKLTFNSELLFSLSYIREVLPLLGTMSTDKIAKTIKDLATHVSDYDTWSLSMDNSHAIWNGLNIYAARHDWEINAVVALFYNSTEQVFEHLENLYAGMEFLIKNTADNAYHYPSVKNPIITMVNAPKVLASEIGRKIIKETNTSVVFVYTHNLKAKLIEFSIRTADDTPISALELAKLYNGGGHENAAGGRLAIETDNCLEFVLSNMQDVFLQSVISQLHNPRNNMG